MKLLTFDKHLLSTERENITLKIENQNNTDYETIVNSL